MPAKGTTIKTGKRHVLVNPKFIKSIQKIPKYKKYTHADLKKIFDTANLHIREAIYNDPSGFRLPNSLGILAINKYKTNKLIVDRKSSSLFKKEIPFLNLHSFGYMFNIKYCRVTNSNYKSLLKCFKFVPERNFKRGLAKIIKETGGEKYMAISNQSFLTKIALTKLFRTVELTD